MKTQEPEPDPRRTLHVARLRLEVRRLGAILRLHEAESGTVSRGPRQGVVRQAPREIEVRALLRDLMKAQEELRDARGAAALGNVVPEARGALFRNSALENALRRHPDPLHPVRILRDLEQAIEEP